MVALLCFFLFATVPGTKRRKSQAPKPKVGTKLPIRVDQVIHSRLDLCRKHAKAWNTCTAHTAATKSRIENEKLSACLVFKGLASQVSPVPQEVAGEGKEDQNVAQAISPCLENEL